MQTKGLSFLFPDYRKLQSSRFNYFLIIAANFKQKKIEVVLCTTSIFSFMKSELYRVIFDYYFDH